MRSSFIAALGLAGILVTGACSSSNEEAGTPKANSSVVAQANTNAASTNANAIAPDAGIQVAPPQPADANAVAGDQLNAPSAISNKLEAMRKSGGTPTAASNAEAAARNQRPAPDNSTFTSYLTDAGYEVRTFKSHPLLSKVEKKTLADGKQTLKVFLKSGKVVDLAPERIPALFTIRAAEIVDLAGITPPRSSGAPPTKNPGN
jgi:hypothetical protein